jgi:serine phosphatase RsbU (regulator of sigma subunit)
MVTEDTNFSFRFMMIQALVIPLVVFDVRETKLQIVGFLAFIISFIVFDTLNEMIPIIEGIDVSKFDSSQTVVINGVLCMITLLIGNRYLQKLNHRAEEELQDALAISNQQGEEIKQKNKFIYEGITYAQRIQQAVLPKKDEIQVFLPDHFVYFKPREIIGGDFYWQGEHGDHILMAAVDCTGHGAPGALISIIGSQILNKIVKDQGTTDPGEVLEILNLEMIKTLHHETSLLKDGMDISLISIDTKNKTLRFAGAKNSLIIMKNGEIQRVRGNQTSIGEAYRIEEGFTTHEIELEKTDNLYMLTDGIIDQFGGPSNKKLLHKRLYDILKKNEEYSMDIQLDCLKRAVDLWQGNLEQTDDILIIGLRIDFEHIAQVQSFRNTTSPFDENTSMAS